MPKQHVKPTKDELKAGIDQSLKDLETIPEPGEEELGEEANPGEEPEIPTGGEEDEPKGDESGAEGGLGEGEEGEGSPNPTGDEDQGKDNLPDDTERLKHSTREAQVLYSKNKKIVGAIESAAGITEPTNEEMAAEYSDWEDMTPTEQRLAKESVVNKKRFQLINDAAQEGKDLDVWNEKVDIFLEDPTSLANNPDLEGKLEEFKVFAAKPTRRGVDMQDLVNAFLFDASKNVKPKHKGQMFERGTGGDNEKPKPKSDKISVDEARRLRKNDYPKYKELLKAGKIDTTNI